MNIFKYYRYFLGFFIALNSFYANSEVANKLLLHQASLENEELITFVGVYNERGKLLKNLTKDDFSISYGVERGEVQSVKEFSSAKFGTSYIFMIDLSKSVSVENFNLIKESIASWVNTLNPGDAASIITFGEEVQVISNLTYDRDQLKDAINAVQRTDMQTMLYDGLVKAHELASEIDLSYPTRKAIICLTDGVNEFPESSTTKKDVLSLMEDNPFPLYVINFAEDSNQAILKGTREMMEIADISRGNFFDANSLSIQKSYELAREYIDETYLITSICPTCIYDNSNVIASISYDSDDVLLSSKFEIELTTPLNLNNFEKGERNEGWQINYLFLTSLSTIALLSILYYFLNRNRNLIRVDSDGEIDFEDNFEETNTSSLKIRISSVSGEIEDYFSIEIRDSVLIGRSTSCDLTIDDQPEISGKHCLLELRRGSLFVSDQSSKNGTFVNGVPIQDKYKLNSRDTLGLGRAEYRLIFEGDD